MASSTRRKKLNLLISRVKGFLSVYKQNKKGLFGIGLILFFILFAFLGPMLTENHPVDDWDVGGRRVPPVWFKNLPGNQNLVPNFNPVKDVGFEDSKELSAWILKQAPRTASP